MLNELERQETTVNRSGLAGCYLALATLGLAGGIASAEESMLLDAVGPTQVTYAEPTPFTESETRVKVYTDSRGRVVREVDLHLVIVDEASDYDPESALWGADKPSVAAAAQQALDGAFEAATRDLAATFGNDADLDTLLTDPSDLFDMDDILPTVAESGLAPWSDDGAFDVRATAVPEPAAATLLALGVAPLLLRRRRNTLALLARRESNRIDTTE